MKAPRRPTSMVVLAMAGSIALLSACTSSTGPSQLEIKLVDAPNPAVDQIVVSVTKVTAHSTTGGWVTVGPMVSPTTVNLLDLQTSALALGLVSLPAGKITQVRLFIAADGNYVVPTGSTAHEPLVVPSGIESGIKILGPWEVPVCARLTVTLDFDGKNSIEYHQANGTWILRPVIRPTKAGSTAIACEPAAPGPTCSVEVACPERQVCVAGACAPAAPLSTGSACTEGPQCLTGSCDDGVCAPGAAGASCGAAGDCASGSCVEGICAAGATALGARSACTSNTECLSGTCGGGMCQPGLQGSLCQVPGDCWSMTCIAGYCGGGGPPPPPM